MTTVICPHCGAEVPLIQYGGGWVAHCCDRIIYNGDERPGVGK